MKKILITGDQDYSLNLTVEKVMHSLLNRNIQNYVFATFGSKYGADKIIQTILSKNYIDFYKFKAYDER